MEIKKYRIEDRTGKSETVMAASEDQAIHAWKHIRPDAEIVSVEEIR